MLRVKGPAQEQLSDVDRPIWNTGLSEPCLDRACTVQGPAGRLLDLRSFVFVGPHFSSTKPWDVRCPK